MTYCNGDKVIVRCFEGKLLVRYVWDVSADGRTIYVCSERNLERLKSDDPRGSYIGFPAYDVFRFDEKYANTITLSDDQWRQLTPYGHGEQAKVKV